MRLRSDQSRRALLLGLRQRAPEIEEAVLARLHAIGGAGDDGMDSEYLEGLRLASQAGIDFSFSALERGDDRAVSLPGPLLNQLRLAVDRQVPLETVLRRYLAAHAVLGDFIIGEAERQSLSPTILRRVLRNQAATTDQIMAMVGSSYVEEQRAVRPLSSGQRLRERVRRLLDGELLDLTGIDYDFDRWHLALLASGSGAHQALDVLTSDFDARRLIVPGGEGASWAWVGTRKRLDPQRIEAAATAFKTADGLRLGIGEPGSGRGGWSLTHGQAHAALSVAIQSSEGCVRYADVAVLASAMRDDLFTTSLRQLYLAPLERGRDGGRTLRETLRTFFAVEQNVSSTAATLGVSRQTVANRLRAVEERVGRPLPDCASELQAALRLSEVRREGGTTENPVAVSRLSEFPDGVQ